MPVPSPSRPTTSVVELALLEVLGALLPDREVGPGRHFFDDLGCDSMTMARFCARVRKRDDLPQVSMRDVYAHPTVARLATALGGADEREPDRPVVVEPEVAPSGGRAHLVCGLAQAVVVVLYAYLVTSATVHVYGWVVAEPGLVTTYLRAVLGGGVAVTALCLLPVVVKWVLVGRWAPTRIPLWGTAYLRWWIVKSLLHSSPMILFVGSPVYVLWLRLLGARIGPGVTILSRTVPVCTDLLTIGAGTVVRKDCLFLGYRAVAGHLETGRVTLGRDAFVGEKTVLDVDTAVGDGAQLGHSSSLQPGERVPDGERRHGVPVEPTTVDYCPLPERTGSSRRRLTFGLAGVLQAVLVYVPLLLAGGHLLVTGVPALRGLLDADGGVGDLVTAAVSLALVGAGLVVGAATVLVVPRLVALVVRPGRVYPLHGLHFSLHRTVVGLTNRRFFMWLTGDSSYVVAYLRGLGYRFPDFEQTGSNFGTEVQHESPRHVTVGGGTMVADGLSILNADYSTTSFRVSEVALGAHSFLGNNIAYPAGARIGEDCLLATKVMVPLDGPVRSGVGLLGSPPFEIPRTVERDSRFDHLREGPELRSRLRAKDRYNLRSMALMLGARWVDVLLVSLAAFVLLEGHDGVLGELLIALYLPVSLLLTTGWFVLVERTVARWRPLEPRLCSIYDPYFWWHERTWKVPDVYLNLYNGTPAKTLVWRLLGVRIGRRVFDDGCYLTERTLTTVGDDAVLNVGSKLQCHSQEDGTFKSDRTRVGAGATLGVGAFVHYGVTVGPGAVVAADAFVMKGEEIPDHVRWAGNPAAPDRVPTPAAAPTTVAHPEREAVASR